MSLSLRQLRAIFTALVALALSAGLAFAGQPTSTGLANAASHANKTVPVVADGDSSEPDETTDTETESDTDASDSADNCNVDLTQDPSVLATLSHGSVVCTAAHTATPDGWANHGAWVSHWAHLGKDKFSEAPKTHGNGTH